MIEVPLVVSAVLPAPSPVCAGDTDALCEVITGAEVAASDCQQFASNAENALANTRGSSIRALCTKLGHLQTSAATVEGSAGAALLAVRQYAQAVIELHVQAREVEQEVAQLLVRVRMSKNEIEEIAVRRDIPLHQDWRTLPPLFMPQSEQGPITLSGDADSFNWQLAAGAWAGALAAVDEACVCWRGLVSQREAAERALIGSLARTMLIAAGPGTAAPRATVAESLTKLLSTQRPWAPAPVQELLSGLLTPAEVAKLWEQLEADGSDVDELVKEYSFEFAALDGLPFRVRDRAARGALDYALSGNVELMHAFARLGLAPDDMTTAELRNDLVAVQDALFKTVDEAGPHDSIQLVTLGSQDGAVTAAISLGDLDAADMVGVMVPGMNSSVHNIDEMTQGLMEIHHGSGKAAMVSWLGYRTPNIAEEAFQGRAERGRWPLASFLDGISATREGNLPAKFALLGHSYGTNVAAEALKLGSHSVDTFVSIGSAGLKPETTSSDLGVGEIHATHAAGDNVAPIGRAFHFRPTSNGGPGYVPRVDPRDLAGAMVFSSEESADGKKVTMHNLTVPIDWGGVQWAADRLDGVASADEVGYLDPASSTVKQIINIMGGSR